MNKPIRLSLWPQTNKMSPTLPISIHPISGAPRISSSSHPMPKQPIQKPRPIQPLHNFTVPRHPSIHSMHLKHSISSQLTTPRQVYPVFSSSPRQPILPMNEAAMDWALEELLSGLQVPPTPRSEASSGPDNLEFLDRLLNHEIDWKKGGDVSDDSDDSEEDEFGVSDVSNNSDNHIVNKLPPPPVDDDRAEPVVATIILPPPAEYRDTVSDPSPPSRDFQRSVLSRNATLVRLIEQELPVKRFPFQVEKVQAEIPTEVQKLDMNAVVAQLGHLQPCIPPPPRRTRTRGPKRNDRQKLNDCAKIAIHPAPATFESPSPAHSPSFVPVPVVKSPILSSGKNEIENSVHSQKESSPMTLAEFFARDPNLIEDFEDNTAKSNEKQSSAKQNKSETSSREKTTKTPSTSLISQLLSAPPYFPVTSAAEILQSRQQKSIPEFQLSLQIPSGFRSGKNDLNKERPEEKQVCSKCKLSFDSTQQLELHLKSHSTSTKSFKCSTCGKEFSKEENLQLHVKLHLGQKDYVCSACHKSYFTRSGLQAHQRQMHNSDASFGCRFCSQTFDTKYDLTGHESNHADSFPGRCVYCPEIFRTNSELKRHIISRHSNRPFACSNCPHRSKTQEKLDRHVLACHQADTNYSCLHCNQKFAYKNSMKKHLQKGRCEVLKKLNGCGKKYLNRKRTKPENDETDGPEVKRTKPEVKKMFYNELSTINPDQISLAAK